MNTKTGQVKSMTAAEANSAGSEWVPNNIIRVPSDQVCRRASRSRHTPHKGKKELARCQKVM